MTNPEHVIADACRDVAAEVIQAIEQGRPQRIDADDVASMLLAIADRLDPPLTGSAEPKPSILDAARALLEARENQMVTQVEWDDLREAVRAAERSG